MNIVKWVKVRWKLKPMHRKGGTMHNNFLKLWPAVYNICLILGVGKAAFFDIFDAQNFVSSRCLKLLHFESYFSPKRRIWRSKFVWFIIHFYKLSFYSLNKICGFFLAIVKSFNAAPDGLLRFCSQPWTVLTRNRMFSIKSKGLFQQFKDF